MIGGLNTGWQIVKEEWWRRTTVRQHVGMEEFVVMPNHLHGILVINVGAGKTFHRNVFTKSP